MELAHWHPSFFKAETFDAECKLQLSLQLVPHQSIVMVFIELPFSNCGKNISSGATDDLGMVQGLRVSS